jgi:hypothetical protein
MPWYLYVVIIEFTRVFLHHFIFPLFYQEPDPISLVQILKVDGTWTTEGLEASMQSIYIIHNTAQR